MPDAAIRVTLHCHELLPGRVETTRTYEWVGPKTSPVRFDLCREELAAALGDLPWPTRAIEVDGFGLSALVVRTDGWMKALYPLHFARHKARRAGRWLLVRLVYTAMVWGLAYVAPGETAGWRSFGKKHN